MSRKLLTLLSLLAVASLAAYGGWRLGRQQMPSASSAGGGERKVLFYQSPMHPWIKSDQPGNCTICGMKLVPIFEGDSVTRETGGTVIKLSPLSTRVANIETAEVRKQPLQRVIRVAGQIDDDDSAHRRLSAYVEGRIDKLFVNFVGAEITAGQPLASLYSRELLIARGEYVQALRQTRSAERETFLAASRQKLRRLGLTAEQIEKLPGQTGDTFDIVAPNSGTVVERKVYEGQYVKEGDVLFEIGNFAKMWFVFDAYERDLAWIRVGQTVEVTASSVPGKVVTAPITFIDPNLVMATRSAKVRVVLDNPLVTENDHQRREFLHKVYAEGRIRVETEPVLTVPRSAVLSPGGRPLVYIVKGDDEYEPRHLTLGRAGEDVWEVLAGLQDGERIVTTGNLLIDAQAQLERPAEAPAISPTSAAPLTAAQQASAEKLFAAASAIAEALASDDLVAHNARIPALHEAAMATVEALGASGARLGESAHVGPVKDLKDARKQFYPLSMAIAELAVQARSSGKVKIFECPMAKSAVPSAETNQGRWVQLVGPIRNPFFGAEMLECGKEVQP